VHDRDHRFSPVFDEVFRAEGIEIICTPWRTPKADAHAERFIRTVRTECLNRMLILAEAPRLGAQCLRQPLQHRNDRIVASTSNRPTGRGARCR
jgi:putative transposase